MWLALAVSMTGALVTLAGVLAVRRREDWARRHKIWFVSFAAGVLIAVPLLHLVPESLAMARNASIGLFTGFILMHLLDRFVSAKVCDRPKRALGLVPLIGIGFHSLLDGVIYSVGFSVGAVTGLLMALGMVLHEFPEGLVTYTLLLCSGYSARRALLLTFIAASISTPLGTLLSYPFVDRLGSQTLGMLLAASAGALLYVGASHLLPQTASDRSSLPSLALLGGMAVAAIIGLIGG
jgi:zinc and cadmium transporter